MPEIKFPSEWLKINENIQDGDLIKFIDAGTFDEVKEVYDFTVQIYHDKQATETKKFSLNKTNFKAISKLHGTNSDNWIGKTMRVTKVKARNPQLGVLVDSIILEEPTAEEKAVPESNV